MSLSCDCDFGDVEWNYISPDDFSILNTKRWRKCCSCKAKILPGDIVGRFERFKEPQYDVEESIYGYGGEIPLAPWYMCETCVGLYWAVDDLGMCCDISESIAGQIKEYRAEEEAARKRMDKWKAKQTEVSREAN